MAAPTASASAGTYWSTVATVMPVLAFALVVEARTIAAKWTAETPRAERRLSSFFWGTSLLFMGFVEPIAVHRVYSEPAPGVLGGLAENAIAYAMGVLVFTPALTFVVRGYAEYIAGLVATHPLVRLKMRRTERDARRTERMYAKQLADMAKWVRDDLRAAAQNEARLDTLEREITEILDALDVAPNTPEVEAARLAATTHRDNIVGLREEVRELRSRMESDQQKDAVWIAESGARLAEMQSKLAEARADVTTWRTRHRQQFTRLLIEGVDTGDDLAGGQSPD